MPPLSLLTATALALPLPWLFVLGWTLEPSSQPQTIPAPSSDSAASVAPAAPANPREPAQSPDSVAAVNPIARADSAATVPAATPAVTTPALPQSSLQTGPLLHSLTVANTLRSSTPTNLQTPGPQAWDRLCPAPQNWQEQLGWQMSQGLGWLDHLPRSLQTSLQNYSGQLLTYAQAAPWPELHPQATEARVPVMMYHDVLTQKEVFFDVTTTELEADFELIRARGLTPISMDDLLLHLQTGMPLPEKPIVLTFDDGYVGHYTEVLPLLERFGYPALFSVFPAKVNGDIVGRSTLTWDQLAEMVASPWVTIASHSVTHPRNLTLLKDDQALRSEIFDSKRILEEKLGVPIRYFTYPEGHYDDRVAALVTEAGYGAALTMDDAGEAMAGASKSLLAIDRFGQSRLESVVDLAWGGKPLPNPWRNFDFTAPVSAPQYLEIDRVPLILVSGGRPITVHADSRYQVAEIMEETEAIAAVDGTFFSLEFLDSNTLIGPVLSQSTGQFLPGKRGENPLINNRPLVLMSPQAVKFVPYRHDVHFTRESLEAELPGVTDAFVGAAWLVREGVAQPAENFGTLFDFDAARDRAFWGINQAGQPVIGVSRLPVDSITLGKVLAQAGLQDAIMLDSGASTSLAYQGKSLMDYEPRPVPHIVGLVPPPAGSIPVAIATQPPCIAPTPLMATEATPPLLSQTPD